METSLNKLLSRQEVAEMLGLTVRGIESLTRRRVLPVIKISGRAVRYDPDAVRHVLENLTIQALA